MSAYKVCILQPLQFVGTELLVTSCEQVLLSFKVLTVRIDKYYKKFNININKEIVYSVLARFHTFFIKTEMSNISPSSLLILPIALYGL